jgi:hypothetical protein
MTFAQQIRVVSEPLRRPVTPSVAPSRAIRLPSVAAGPVASDFDRLLLAWKAGNVSQRPAKTISNVKPDFSQAARDRRRFEMKTHIATVAMHLDPVWRQSLFKQIDNLLDVGDEPWEEENDLPSMASWTTFIRLVIHYKFRTRPALGVFEGNVSATWLHNDIRLTVEAVANDDVRWVASRDIPASSEREAVAGESTLKRLSAFLMPFDVNEWLLNG